MEKEPKNTTVWQQVKHKLKKIAVEEEKMKDIKEN